MKKHIALGIAAAVLGVSGVAGAVVSVDQLTSAASSSAGISAATDQLAANCWMVTGSANDAGCTTSVAGLELPGLPGLPDLPDLPGVGIPDATGLLANAVDTATDAVGSAQGLAGGLVPTACNLPNLPKVVPAGIFSAGLNLFHMAQNLAMNDLGAASLPSPVELPVAVPAADDVINTVEDEIGCLAASAGGSPIPAACTGNLGLPSAAAGVIPSDISGLLGTVAQQLAGITGQGVNVAGSGNLGVNCNLDAAVGQLPALPATPALPALPTATLPVLPAAPALPALPAAPALPQVPSVPAVTDTVNDVIGTVTDVVGGVLPVDVPALPLPTSTPSCSASGSVSLGGLLGSLTSTITGGCK